MLIDNIEEMQLRDTAIAESRKARKERRGESDSDESADDEVEKCVGDVDEAARLAAIERMAAAKAAKAAADHGDEDAATSKGRSMEGTRNPNAKKGRSEFSVKTLDNAEVGVALFVSSSMVLISLLIRTGS